MAAGMVSVSGRIRTGHEERNADDADTDRDHVGAAHTTRAGGRQHAEIRMPMEAGMHQTGPEDAHQVVSAGQSSLIWDWP